MKTNALIFDFDSTLVDYHASDDAAIFKVASMLPGRVDRRRFLERSGEIIVELYERKAAMGSKIHRARLERTVHEFGFAWRDEYLDAFMDAYLAETPPYPGAEELLDSLRCKTRLGLLTNSEDALEQRFRIARSGLEKHFCSVVIAKEIGYFKPAREAFDTIAARLGVRNEECVFVGDSEKYDIEGAKNAGMGTIKRIRDPARPTIADQGFARFDELGPILREHYGIG